MKKILQVLKGEQQSTPPIWLMRQAGRYLPEYMKIREQAGDFLTLCYTPDYASEVTLQPIRRFDFDAAIIFSDILVIPHALGQEVRFEKGEGPRLGTLDVAKLSFDINHLNPVFEALAKTRAVLAADKTLIGFAGAPWTVACYMIEGKGSKDWEKVRNFAYRDEEGFQALISILVEATAEYLIKQVGAGANVLQIFDSWAGVLSEEQYHRWVIAPTAKIVELVKEASPDTPIIGFPRGSGEKIAAYISGTNVDAVSLDTSVSMIQAKALQNLCPVQGNLDPVALLAGGTSLEKATQKILEELTGGPFIFNLGHGIIKETPPENVSRLVDIVRNFRA